MLRSTIRVTAAAALAACLAAVSLRPVVAAVPPAAPANLLSLANGTIVRMYTPGLTDVQNIADGGGGMDENVKGPVQIVFEMPGVATLSALTVTLDTDVKATVSISTTSATDGFRDVGTPAGSGEAVAVAGAAGAKARWVRVTATVASPAAPISQIVATGTLAPRPVAGAPSGDFLALGTHPYDNGRLLAQGPDPVAHLIITPTGAGLNGTHCSASDFVQAYPGMLSGRVWTYRTELGGNEAAAHLVINDEGTVIAGTQDGDPRVFVRAPRAALPDFCKPVKAGTGSSGALLLNSPHWDGSYPAHDETLDAFKNASMTIAPASLLTPALLNGMDIAVLNGVCHPQYIFNSDQTSALVQWVEAGHKLLITDSDMCGDPVKYDFLPYKFTSDNPGAKGATGHTLLVVEDDSLGTTNAKDTAHFVDTTAYVHNDSNQLGDANTVVTQDAHWCGHLFGVNANDVNGFMEMYALYGKGLIIFNGLDVDDAAVPQYQRIRQLEYAETLPPDLPCSRRVTAGFVIASDASRDFVPGTAATVTVPMQVLSNRDWKGHVTLAASGDFPATVTPAAIDLPPATGTISIAVAIPTTATSGHYAITVKGVSGSQTAQATISLNAPETSSALKTALAANCTVPIYGVNFDFNKTTIRPDAEPVLQQILALFKGDPALVAEIGGHTDNVGTAAYNMTLSAGRAEAVRSWLVAHGIAAARITTHGYGDTAPIVPNDSDANRGKNRRVEIKKPNCAGTSR